MSKYLPSGREIWVTQGMPGAVPSPRVRGHDVVYLDFDGVLHHEDVCIHPRRGKFFGSAAARSGRENKLFEHCGLLEELLAPYPNVKIVLSTTWVQHYGFVGARAYLTRTLQDRCVGTTYHSEMQRDLFRESSRGMQIWSDVGRRNPTRWLAIDDDAFGWPAWCRDRLIHSNEVLGISDPVVLEELKRKLASTFDRLI